MLNSTNIKTWISDLRAVSGAVRAADMSVATIGAVDYAKALDGLSLKQAQLMLTTQGIVGEEQKDLLVKQGLIATSDRMSASLVSEALANNGLNKEKQEELLIDLGLMNSKTKELITENAVTEAKFRAMLAEKGIKGAKADTLVASVLQTGANGTEAISWDVLTASIWANIKALATWFVSSPVGWILMATGAVVGFIKVVDHFAITAEKLNDQLQELKATEEELISAQDKLTEIDNKIAEIQSKGTLSITDNADISRLEQEKLLLKDEIELLEKRKELQQDEYNKNAKKYADGEYSNYTHGQGDITHLMNSYKGYKAKSERTDIDDYFIEDAKKGLKETEAKLIEYRNTINENLANLAPDDEESRKKLETIREAIEKLIYTEEELAKIKFDRFIIDPNNTGIAEGFEKIKSDGEVTTQEITELANKLPTLKKFMDDNGISAETLAAELNNVGTEAENSGENVDKMTVQLEDLKNASDGISKISDAFNSLSEDGFIPVEKIAEIKEAVGSSVKNWEDYEKILLTAKSGSAELNNALSDLTYATLEAQFASVGLENATEEQIAAILRENDVANADALAIEYLARAKAQAAIDGTDFADIESLNIQQLIDEGVRAGITEAQMYNLILSHIQFNNTSLNSEQKVAALMGIATAAGIAKAEIDKVFGASSTSDWNTKQSWMADNDVTATEDAQGRTGKTKDGKTYNYKDYMYNGVRYDTVDDVNAAITRDKIKSQYSDQKFDFSTVNYIPKSSSKKDTSADDAKKKAEEAEKARIKAFKEGLDARKDILDRYKEHIKTLDFGLEILSEEDFEGQFDTLTLKLEQATEYGKALKAEFEEAASTIPQTGEEAEALGAHLESLGSDIRSNIEDINKMTVALEKAKIGMLSGQAQGYIDEMSRDIESLERRIEILRADDKNDYKYTNKILNMEMLLPNQSTINEKVREKSKEDREIIKMEQETQDTLDGILRTQIKKNEKLRADERAKLLVNMEELKVNTQKKINEVQASYKYSLQQNEKNTQESCNAIANKIDSTDVQFPDPNIDFSKAKKQFEDFGKVVDSLDKKALSLAKSLGLISEYSGTSTPKPMPGTSGSGDSGGMPFDNLLDAKNGIDGTSETLGGSFDEKLKDFETKIDEWLDQHSGDGYPFEKKYNISSYYGYRIHPIYGYRKFHSGVDFNAPFGAKILSVSSGTVELSSWNGGYGNCIIVRDGSGNKWLYGHMAEQSVLGVGDKVGKGQVIGYVGSTGLSTGPHLHLERRTSDNSTVDPLPHLPYYAKGTLKGNLLAKKLGIAGENYKSEILVDKFTGKMEFIDTPTIIDTTKTDVIGEKATANIPKFAKGTPTTDEQALRIIKEVCDKYGVPYTLALSILDQEKANEITLDKNKDGKSYSHTSWQLYDGGGVWNQVSKSDKDFIEAAKVQGKDGENFYEAWKIATDYALKYLADNYKKLGSWQAAAGAYNGSGTYGSYAKSVISRSETQVFKDVATKLAGGNFEISAVKETPPEIKKISDITDPYDAKYDEADKTYKRKVFEANNKSSVDKSYTDLEYAKDLYKAAKEKSDAVLKDGEQAYNDVLWEYFNYMDNGGDDSKVIQAFEDSLKDLKDAVVKTEKTMIELRDTAFGVVEDSISDIDDIISENDFYDNWEKSEKTKLEFIAEKQALLDTALADELITEKEYKKRSKEIAREKHGATKEVSDRLIQAINRLISDKEETIKDRIEELSLEQSQYKSQATLLQNHFDIINSISQEQYNINKELNASMTMYEYLNEETRKLLFNQKDYNILSKELNEIQEESNRLKARYEYNIRNTPKEKLAEVTAEYQRQYKLLMKNYEISKSDLEVAKKKQQLENILNERNVRMFINGRWQWVAKTQDVINAQNELSDAKYKKSKAETSLLQENELNELQATQDMIGTQMNLLDKDIKDWRKQWNDIMEDINGEEENLYSVLKEIANSNVPALQKIIVEVGDSLGKLITEVTGKEFSMPDISINNSFSTTWSWDDDTRTDNNSKSKANGVAFYPGLGEIAVHVDDDGNITDKGLPDDVRLKSVERRPTWSWASGTRNTPSGLTLMGEDGQEVYITANGRLIPINQPTIGNIPGGGIVFNSSQMKNLRDMWDMANTWTPSSKDLLNRNISSSSGDTNCNNIYINGVKIDDNSGIINVDALKRYIANHS